MKFVAKILFSPVVFAICLTPAGIIYWLNSFLNPTTFWQKLVTLGCDGVLALFQILAVFLFVALMTKLWED